MSLTRFCAPKPRAIPITPALANRAAKLTPSSLKMAAAAPTTTTAVAMLRATVEIASPRAAARPEDSSRRNRFGMASPIWSALTIMRSPLRFINRRRMRLATQATRMISATVNGFSDSQPPMAATRSLPVASSNGAQAQPRSAQYSVGSLTGIHPQGADRISSPCTYDSLPKA